MVMIICSSDVAGVTMRGPQPERRTRAPNWLFPRRFRWPSLWRTFSQSTALAPRVARRSGEYRGGCAQASSS
jgi:hypothetical protein